jgi:hypothetical protein
MRNFGLPKTTNPLASGAQPPAGPLSAPNTQRGNVIHLPTSRELNPRDEADLAAAFERRPFHSGGPDIRELATSIFVFSAICLPMIFWGAVIYLFLLP